MAVRAKRYAAWAAHLKALLGGLGVVAWWLVGCSPALPGPATPTPALLQRYEHPGGVFSLQMPSSWLVADLSEGPGLLVSCTPPGAERVMLTVYVARLAATLDEAAFRQAMDAYLDATYNATLTVLERTAMGDGSWRVTGVRQAWDGSLPVNVFMQRDGPFFSALEVVVPPNDPASTALLSLVVNSYRVDETADWPVGVVEAVPQPAADLILAGGNLVFSGVRSWTDEVGRLHISGRLANRAPYPLEGIEVRATLYDSAGQAAAEQVGIPPALVLLDGEYTPFEVRFDGGRPPAAVRVGLRAMAERAVEGLRRYYGPQHFDWDDRAEYDDTGRLHIRGTVWNRGGEAAHNVQAIITFFDDADRVIGYVTAEPGEGPLAPGASTRFDVPVPRLGAEPARYLVSVQAETQP